MSEIEGAVERYYTAKLEQHGTTPEGVDWNGESGQHLRFEQLLAVGDRRPVTSILDWGCGYGALLDVVRARWPEARYVGYDVSEAMVAAAAERYRGDPAATFTSDAGALEPADVVVASGIFNVRLDTDEETWSAYVLDTIAQMVAVARHGVAFNVLTGHSDADRKRSDLFYADPAWLLDVCLRRHARDVALRHDYELYEFTVLIRTDGRPPVA